MRRRIILLSVAVVSLLGLIALGVFFSLPSWKRAIQVAYWTQCLDDTSVQDQVVRAAADESRKVSTKQEKADIFFYALLIRDPGGSHDAEELADSVVAARCGRELASLIKAIPESEWNKLSDDRKQSLRAFLSDQPFLVPSVHESTK